MTLQALPETLTQVPAAPPSYCADLACLFLPFGSCAQQAASYESMQVLSAAPTPPDSLRAMDILASPSNSDAPMGSSSPLINVPTLTFPGTDGRVASMACTPTLHLNVAGLQQLLAGGEATSKQGLRGGLGPDAGSSDTLASLMEPQEAQYDFVLPGVALPLDTHAFLAAQALAPVALSPGCGSAGAQRVAAGMGAGGGSAAQGGNLQRAQGEAKVAAMQQQHGLGSVQMHGNTSLSAAAAADELLVQADGTLLPQATECLAEMFRASL